MAELNTKYPIDFRANGDSVHEYADNHIREIDRIYDIINTVRENKEGSYEPQAHQIMISSEGKFYIRNTENTSWVYIGEVNQENLGLKNIGFVDQTDLGFSKAETSGELNSLDVNIKGNAAKIANVLIAAQALADGQALVYDDVSQRFINRKVPIIDDLTGTISVSTTGSAGSIGDKPVLTDNIQDGEILVYRPSLGGFVNETKATGVGAKEISFVINKDISLGAYSGTATTNISLLAYGKDVPKEQDTSLPPFWIPVEL